MGQRTHRRRKTEDGRSRKSEDGRSRKSEDGRRKPRLTGKYVARSTPVGGPMRDPGPTYGGSVNPQTRIYASPNPSGGVPVRWFVGASSIFRTENDRRFVQSR